MYKSSQPSNFLRGNFLDTFSTDSKSASNAFFDTHIENVWKIKFLRSYKHFLQTYKRAQKRSNIVKLFKMCTRIQFCIHSWVRTFNFFKNCQNRCSSHDDPNLSTTIIYTNGLIYTDNFVYEKGAHLHIHL